ncbi:reverse transcriptase domain-containing protein [Tanacetum coccineum]
MRTRSQARKRRQQQVRQTSVESPNLKKPNNNQETFNPPVVTMTDNRIIAQLLEAPTEGYEDAIVVPEITANNFEIKHGLLNLVQNKQFFGHDKEDPHAHIRYFNKITSMIKFPNILKLHQLDTFYNALNSNDQDSLNSAAGVIAKVSTSSSTSAVSSDVAELKDMVRALFLDKKNQTPAPTPVKAVEQSCVTCGGGHSYQNCLATNGNVYRDNIQEYVSLAAAGNFNQGTGYRPQMVANQIRPPGFPPVQNHQGNNQNNFNRGNNYNQNRGNNYNQIQIHRPQVNQPPAYQALVPQTQGVSKTDFENYVTANDAVLRNMQNQGQTLQNQIANLTDMFSKFVTSNTTFTSGSRTLSGNTVTNLKEDLKGITTRSGITYQGPKTPSTSSLSPKVMNRDTEVTKDTMRPTNNESTKDVQPPVVQVQSRNPISEPVVAPDLSFQISFTDGLMLMPKFASTLKTLIGNKEKLSEMARTPLNENCSAVILNKLPKKLGDPGQFLIPCEFTEINTCNALADLGTSINLMPYSVWKDLSLPELTPNSDFVVVDFKPDPRVPLILGRSFLKTSRALIDVYEGEITLRVGKEAITFNLDQTSRYTTNYNHMTENRIDIIDMASEEYSQKVLGFFNSVAYGNPSPYYDPIVSNSSPTLTPFKDSDFLLLEEANAFIAINDEPISREIDATYYDPEGDILILEALLNSDMLPPLPNHKDYSLGIQKELKVVEAKTVKSSIDEPSEVLKSHKRAIAWKLSDIKGVDPEFCTHKILMEEDYEPTVQNQRQVNPKIYDVIKKEVEKLLNAGLIYPISDSSCVSPVHYIPKKGGITVIKNDENDLIPTRLVKGWRVCIDYKKLNEATRKDHFPFPFLDQMFEKFAGNQYYCFLDDFSGYFQIPINLKDQEKTTFTCPYGTFTYLRMPFGLCNAPDTFQRCMMAIFHDMIEKIMEVFMDDFSVFRDSFSTCLSHLEKMLKRCEDTNLALN